jgi:uncharacterized membrane protein YeaQ/YmgE (transglycosylase-associated protein family)
MFLISAFVVIALVAGFVANWLVGRGRGYETWELFVAGIVGSFVGGLIFNLVAGNGLDFQITGLVGSILGAIVVLAIYGPLRTTLRPSLRNKPATKNTALPEKRKNR